MTECGTYAAYQRHKRRGEPACQPCCLARNAYAAHRWADATPETRLAKRVHRRAYERALSRLRQQHRGEFAALLREERKLAEADARLVQAQTAGTEDSWREEPDAT